MGERNDLEATIAKIVPAMSHARSFMFVLRQRFAVHAPPLPPVCPEAAEPAAPSTTVVIPCRRSPITIKPPSPPSPPFPTVAGVVPVRLPPLPPLPPAALIAASAVVPLRIGELLLLLVALAGPEFDDDVRHGASPVHGAATA